MFKRNHDRDERAVLPPMPLQQSGGARRGMFSVIGPDIVITGNIAATADLHIDGRVEGDVHCASLAAGAESRIFGNVTAETARISGAIEGAVRVKQLVVERSARIAGDVEYETISIENGAHIDGRLKRMGKAELDGDIVATPIAPAELIVAA